MITTAQYGFNTITLMVTVPILLEVLPCYASLHTAFVNEVTLSYLEIITIFLFVSHGAVYYIKMEILGLKDGFTTLLYVLDMVGSTRNCWLVVDCMERQSLVTHGYWTHSQGDGRR